MLRKQVVDALNETCYNVNGAVPIWRLSYKRTVVTIFLYHGTMARYKSKFEMESVTLKHAKPYADFGRGFYTSPSYDFAKRTAVNTSQKYNNLHGRHVTDGLVITLDCDEWLMSMLNTKEFDGVTEEWLHFVIHNRVNERLRDKTTIVGMDIITGYIADADISSIAASINAEERAIDDVRLEECLAFKDSQASEYAIQTSFHTEDALTCLKIVKYDIIRLSGRRHAI